MEPGESNPPENAAGVAQTPVNAQENAHDNGLHELIVQWNRLAPEQRSFVLVLIRQLAPPRDGD